MAIINVTQNVPAKTTAMQITAANFMDFTTVFPTLAGAAYQCTLMCLPPASQGGAAQWQVTLNKSNFPTQIGALNDWIVFDGVHAQIIPAAQFPTEYTQSA